MVEDEEGFEYPQIDESKCVRCYQCIAVVKESFRGMLERGVYKEELFCDIK